MHKINSEIVSDAISNMVAKNKCDGVKSGFRTLDHLTNGFGRGQLIVLGALTGMGKTTFACSVIDNVCIKAKRSCVYFSPSSSKELVVQRLIRIHGDIQRKDKDMERISSSAAEVVDSPLWIDDSPAIYINEIIQKCRAIRKDREIDLIVVDDLQFLSDKVEGEKGTITEQERIVGKLKILAQELQSPILLLTKLNASVWNREDHVPVAADLPIHAVLGSYVDVILLLHRQYYFDKEDDRYSDDRYSAHIYIARSKNSDYCGTMIRFDPDIPKFLDWDCSDAEYELSKQERLYYKSGCFRPRYI